MPSQGRGRLRYVYWVRPLRFGVVKNNWRDWRFIFGLLKDTFNAWMEDNALRLSAALAYYTTFSIAPLLVIMIALAGLFLGQEAVTGELDTQLSGMLGAKAAEGVQAMVKSASQPSESKIATIVGILTLLLGASAIFGQLKDALNTIWEVKSKPGLGFKGFLHQRVLSFGMVAVIGFLLLISLLMSTALTGFSHYLGRHMPLPPFILTTAEFLLSFVVITFLFAMIFKVLPDTTVDWKHVWIGAAVTALLFDLGKLGLSLYLGRESTASTYGAAASVVLLLLWVYYASCILLFGAEFTQIYAKATGFTIEPNEYAVAVTAEMRAQQGLTPSKNESPGAIVPVPIYTPPPTADFPKSMADVPRYFRESPAVSVIASIAGGYVLGLLLKKAEKPLRTPAQEVAHGSRALALAAVPLAAGLGRGIWEKVRERIDVQKLARAGRQMKRAMTR